MATSTRVEELRLKFAENPRRYFAPLANELRKLGDLEQAIAICRTHLPAQPGHVSGHIVLAQALHEAGDMDGARSEFEAALELDPENLIALRHMGDMSRGRADLEGARGWYQRVLDADPRNDEIARVLRELHAVPNDHAPNVASAPSDAAREQPPEADGDDQLVAAPAASFDAPPVADVIPVPEPTSPDSATEVPAESVAPVAEAVDPFVAELDIAVEPSAPVSAPIGDAPAVTEAPALETLWDAEPAPASELDDFDADESPSGSELGDFEAAPEDWFGETGDLGTFESPAATTQVPEPPADSASRELDEIESLFAAPAEQPPAPEAEPAPEFDLASADDATATPAVQPEAERHDETQAPASAAPVEPEPMVGRTPAFSSTIPAPSSTPFVTETLAELYLQQGFREEALQIYRQLVEKNPSDQALRDRVAALEVPSTAVAAAPTVTPPASTEKAARSVRTFFGRLAARQPHSAANSTSSASALTQLFATSQPTEDDATAAASLAEAFSQPAPTDSGRASRTSPTELSLDHLFRESSAASQQPVTLDDFYAAHQAGKAPADPAAPGASDERAADIKQFTSWLEGLKKK